MPELFVSISSALQGSSDISIGNVIGSNICNLLLMTPEEQQILYENNKMLKKLCD